MAIRKNLVEVSGVISELPSGDYIQVASSAVAEGATSPDPGGTSARGVTLWSTTTNALMRWGGTSWSRIVTGAPGTTLGQQLALINKAFTQ